MDLFDVPGMSVAVVKDGEIYAQGFGMRNAAMSKPVTPDTMFYVASVTKTFNAVAVLRLIGEGKLSLSDPVQKRLPAFTLPDAEMASRLTIEDMLSFRQGIYCDPASVMESYTGEITDARFWHWMKTAAQTAGPRYTNITYSVLGRVIGNVSGRSWKEYLIDEVARPAGLTRVTTSIRAMEADDNHATPMRRDRQTGEWSVEVVRKTEATMPAAGGMSMSAADGARWLRVLLAGGQADGTRVAPEALVRSMTQMHAEFEKPRGAIRIGRGFGYAWELGTFNDHWYASRGGDYPGWCAACVMLPQENAGFVVFMNSGELASGMRDVVYIDLLERFTGTKNPKGDLLDQYTERIRRVKETGDWTGLPPAAGEPGRLPAESLTLEPKQYEGQFTHPMLGTLRARVVSGGLEFAYGQWAVNAKPIDGVKDAFMITSIADGEAKASFIIDAGGRPTGVTMEDPALGALQFTR
jgi:CubicO group peptidase (beta-lactamase class C family)